MLVKGVVIVSKLHYLNKEVQDEYYYSIGPYMEPVLEVDSGSEIVVETEDTFEGKIKDEKTKPAEVIEVPFLNPQNGPIFVEGACKGDALAVEILEISPRGPQPRGTTCLVENLGALTGTDRTVTLDSSIPERTKKTRVTEEYIYWDEEIKIPYEPFLGTLGTSPEIDSINTLTPGVHGGNMDLPEVAPGATIFLPVKVAGGYLFLGDAHAAQGDGEICGNAVEIASTTRIKVSVKKNWRLTGPRIINEDEIISVGSTRPLEDAVRMAYGDLIDWMSTDYNFDKLKAYQLLSQVGKLTVGNVVDPNYTVGARINKKYLQ